MNPQAFSILLPPPARVPPRLQRLRRASHRPARRLPRECEDVWLDDLRDEPRGGALVRRQNRGGRRGWVFVAGAGQGCGERADQSDDAGNQNTKRFTKTLSNRNFV